MLGELVSLLSPPFHPLAWEINDWERAGEECDFSDLLQMLRWSQK